VAKIKKFDEQASRIITRLFEDNHKVPSYFYPNICYFYEGVLYEHEKAKELKKQYLKVLKSYLNNESALKENLARTASEQQSVVVKCSMETEKEGMITGISQDYFQHLGTPLGEKESINQNISQLVPWFI
jgi:hypothetical protein